MVAPDRDEILRSVTWILPCRPKTYLPKDAGPLRACPVAGPPGRPPVRARELNDLSDLAAYTIGGAPSGGAQVRRASSTSRPCERPAVLTARTQGRDRAVLTAIAAPPVTVLHV